MSESGRTILKDVDVKPAESDFPNLTAQALKNAHPGNSISNKSNLN